MTVKALAMGGFVLPFLAGQALAHHSFAMFNPDHLVTQAGIVKELEWTNPHVWLHVVAPDASGKAVEWSFEMQAVAQATSGGWRPDIVRPGDKISVDFYPLRDGSRGGELVSATLSDGKRLAAQAARLPGPQSTVNRDIRKEDFSMDIKTIALAGMALTMAAPALAHHSFAMFDREKSVTMTGTVKEFEWTNPHAWIHMMVADSGGKPVVWSFEMQAIQADMAGGWRADSVKPGDKVSIEFHPLKDGSRGGQLVSATLANGQHLGGPVRRPGAQD